MKKSVLFICTDQWRWDCFGFMKHKNILTPNIDKLANKSTVFTSHFAGIVPCGPARTTMLTGLYPFVHRSVTNGAPLDKRFTNIAKEAKKKGYDPKLYGYTDTFLSSETSSLRTQENYRATHSTDAIIRHRIKARVEEPFGPHTTTFTITPNHKLTTITLSTASADVYASSSAYQTNTSKSIIHYTSSWFEKDYVAGSYTQGHSISDDAATTVSPNIASDPTLAVTASVNSTIDITAQVEQTNSGSNTGGSQRAATYLHGRDRSTIIELSDQADLPNNESKNQMVRARILAHISEPFGPKTATMSTNLKSSVEADTST